MTNGPRPGREGPHGPGQEESPVPGSESEAERLVLRLYMQEIIQIPLLTAAEELECGRQIAEGRAAARRLASGDGAERPELSERVKLALTARRRLVEGTLRLVVSVARRYRGRGLSLLDLIQEGNIGLMRAVEKFDHSRGLRFSTYATWWIRQAVGRALLEQSRTIRLPVYLLELVSRVARTREELAARLNRSPTEAEVAAELGESVERVAAAGQVVKQLLSLESPVSEEDGTTLTELIADPATEDPAEVVARELDAPLVGAALHLLSPRERLVLELRAGLGTDRPHTLAEVAERLALSRERVRQIEREALTKLRHPAVVRRLRELLG